MVKVRAVEVAPGMSLKVLPLSVLTCHCTVGVGEPLAAAWKVTEFPSLAVWFVGLNGDGRSGVTWIACQIGNQSVGNGVPSPVTQS